MLTKQDIFHKYLETLSNYELLLNCNFKSRSRNGLQYLDKITGYLGGEEGFIIDIKSETEYIDSRHEIRPVKFIGKIGEEIDVILRVTHLKKNGVEYCYRFNGSIGGLETRLEGHPVIQGKKSAVTKVEGKLGSMISIKLEGDLKTSLITQRIYVDTFKGYLKL